MIDAVRIEEQVDGLREAFGKRVIHLHLTATDNELTKRYSKRAGEIEELPSYKDAKANPTESNIGRLANTADAVIFTDRCTPNDVLTRALGHLRLLPRSIVPCVDVIIGGQYGSEGKGNIVAYISREYDFLVRVGGPNAGHKVYEEPEPYTFHQLPSGSRHSESRLIIGPGAVINLDTLLREIDDCRVSHERLSIDPQALIIEQQDIDTETATLKDTIASTAQGVGAAASRRIMGRGNIGDIRMAGDISDLHPYIRPTLEVLESAYAEGKSILLEGTQGTSLSIFHGSYPHVTSRDTTVAGCLAEAGIPPGVVRRVIMVCRTYPIRVGDPSKGISGPMSQLISLKEISSRSNIPYDELRKTERTSTTDRRRKIAEFDWKQLH